MNKQDILKQCTVEGRIIKLPDIRIHRELYEEVKNSLELVGGKWKGAKVQGFVFEEDPTTYLKLLCEGKNLNIKKEFQFYGTPDELSDYLVKLADIEPHHSILEPSAGRGAIIKAIHKVCPDTAVDCYELMDLNRYFLEQIPNVQILGTDFLIPEDYKKYDRIIANPPFSRNQDIAHVNEMMRYLKDDGRIVSVMSRHWQHSKGRKEEEFKNFINEHKFPVINIEEGVFKESGTNFATCIVIIDKTSQDSLKKIIESTEAPKAKQSQKRTPVNDIDYENLPSPEEILKEMFEIEKNIQTSLLELADMLGVESLKPISKSQPQKSKKDNSLQLNLFE